MADVDLRSLAKAHKAFDDAVTFWMMPYSTYAANDVVATMDAIWFPPQPETEADGEAPKRERTSEQTIYLTAPYCTVNIEFADDLPVIAQALQMYWQARTGDVVENYERFRMLPIDVVNSWFNAYLETRDNSIYANGVAPEEQGDTEETDPESSASNG